jgi:hypothetical protein
VCNPQFDLYLPNALSAQAFDLDSVIELVGAALRNEQISTNEEIVARAEVARSFIENVEGKRACERFLDALERIDLPEQPLDASVSPLNGIKTAAKKKIQRIVKGAKNNRESLIRTWSRESAARKKSHALKSDNVNRADLITMLQAAQSVTGRFGNVQIAELEKNLLCIF